MRHASIFIIALAQLGCVYSGGAGVTVARSKGQWAVGPTIDITSNTWASRGSRRLPNSVPTVGLGLGFDTLFPVYRLEHEVLQAVFAAIRVTLPLLEDGEGFGWEVAGTLGVRGYVAYGSGTDAANSL